MASSTSRRGFHGKRSVLRANAQQAAVPTDALPAVAAPETAFDTRTNALSVRVTELTVLCNEMRAALVEKGIFKGGA